ncbi:SusC/RagA family TonB-linked outer membrane protein [Segatella maculosa]|uniref:SusC/RagA family TonB-linked outer membrane protein n=1 Tax=Segatella maculosa TaxID=439703 RepID=UPI00036EDEF5|nr:TonB-dependent receptor [Segatella maculosa]
MMKKNLVMTLLMLLVVQGAFAQALRVVTGKVVDANDGALIGATVSVPGRSLGTVTGLDGSFSLKVPTDVKLISVSYLGYETQSVNIAGKDVVNVKMEENKSMLNEVVVVGYGVQRRKDVTGAVISVRTDDLKNMPSTNIMQSLQGKLPGLNITNTSNSESDGNSGLSYRVRGQRSINRDAAPLIILDGIQYNGFLSEISPNDIESMEVLKDASSAAIYGSKAANGVILINTKKGVSGRPVVSFSGTMAVSNAINKPDMMTGDQYFKLNEERIGPNAFLTDQHDKGVNTNWLDLALQTGFKQDYNLSVSGGTKETQYFISGNASMNKGVARNDEFNRYTLRANIDTRINPWLKIGTSTALTYADRPGRSVNLVRAMKMNPLAEPYDENGKLVMFPDGNDAMVANPLDALYAKHEDVGRAINTVNYAQIDFPFVKGLSYKFLTGYNYRTRLVESYQPRTTAEGSQKNGVSSVNNQFKEDWSIENILSYNKTFDKHTLFLTAVYSANKMLTKYHNISGTGFPSDYREYYQFADATTLKGTDTYIQRTAIGQMFRANYSYDSRYLFTFTVRRDGDSAFGKNSKYGVFPSLALGWNMENEKFMDKLTWLDHSKLRLSWGKNGNQAIEPYDAMATMNSRPYLDAKDQPVIGYYSKKLADPSLSWETTEQWNIGWDYSFLKGRLFGSLDIYFSNTYDLLLNKVIPQINGSNNILQNMGKTHGHGIELQISSVNIRTKDFTWRTDFNISHDRNKIIDIGLRDEHGNPADNKANSWFIGKPIGVIYGYEFAGIWQEDEDIAHSYMPTAKPGDVKVLDYNKDGKITPDDRHVFGYKTPDYRVGLMNTFTYKNLSLSFFLHAVHGVTRYTEYNNTYFEKQNIRNRTWWTPENKINTYPANRSDSNPYGLNYFGKTNDASFIRLSDISLSYRFPERLIRPLRLSNLELFGNVKNVFTITHYVGMDPELSGDYTTPPMRTFLFGVRVSL